MVVVVLLFITVASGNKFIKLTRCCEGTDLKTVVEAVVIGSSQFLPLTVLRKALVELNSLRCGY